MKKIFLLILVWVSSQANASKPASTFVFDESKNDVITASEANIPRPIASLTKIMTALVALEYDSNMDRMMKVSGGSKLPPGYNSRGDVFTSMLVRSDNRAAEILAEDYPGGRKAFIKAMNQKAQNLQMYSTRYTDPSGLSSGNVATVGEVAMLIQIAALQPILADTSILRQVEIRNRKYKVLLDNTNRALLARFDEIKFSKTGFTNAAGWNVGMIIERQGKRFVVVILGAKSKEHRYNLAKSLIEKHFADIEFEIEQEKKEEENKSLYQKIIDRVYGKDCCTSLAF
jgi:D-alanyl-D-alanine endopeptidase (penicillin-binding protein 7)